MTSSVNDIVQGRKVSLKYDSVEDRIRLTVETDDEQVLEYWLTYRLCRQLVPSLVTFFDQQSIKKTTSSVENRTSVQTFLQQEARQARKPVSPIRQPGDVMRENKGSPALLESLRLRTRGDLIALVITLEDERHMVVPLPPTKARQWFEIFYQQYKLAGWSLSLWPAWIKDDNASQSAGSSGQHLH